MNRIREELLEGLQQEILDWKNDYLAESLTAYLVNRGLNPEQIILENQGTAKRSYRKEVSGFRTEISDYDNREYLYLQTNKEGFYDALPQNLFHQPSKGRTEKNTSETIQEIRNHKQEQAEARKFFLPFEYGFQHIRLLLKLFEQDFEKQSGQGKLVAIFAEQFEVLKRLEPFPAYIFLRLIPLIHQIRNDFRLVEECLQMIFNISFKIELVYGDQAENSFTTGVKLGECGLGVDLVTDGVVADGNPSIKITIGPVKQSIIPAFITGGESDLLLDELLGYLVGVEYEMKKELLFDREDKEVNLSEGMLGVSLFL
ncbi:MAG: type VI secretion system baseplate subunit TssG [Opitutaceae bacterium]|nr:type VI secretion system baseplate subunit TssG [Cytophagales bacterium]